MGHKNMYESPFNLNGQLTLRFLHSRPTFPRRINVDSALWIKVKSWSDFENET